MYLVLHYLIFIIYNHNNNNDLELPFHGRTVNILKCIKLYLKGIQNVVKCVA